MGTPQEPFREALAGNGSITESKVVTDGIVHAKGVIPAGKAGCENSWAVSHVMDITVSHIPRSEYSVFTAARLPQLLQYYVRTIIEPPDTVSSHLPSWRNDTVVQITTAHYGTLENELISTGGVPSPAAAMAIAVRVPREYTLIVK